MSKVRVLLVKCEKCGVESPPQLSFAIGAVDASSVRYAAENGFHYSGDQFIRGENPLWSMADAACGGRILFVTEVA